MFLTGYLQPPHCTRATSRFSIYMVFTCFLQAPFLSFTLFLHVSYRPPFFHLHGFYMFLTGPLFSFTWFLHASYRPPFFIYMVFKCFLQAPFFYLHGFYMFLTGPLFHWHGFYMFLTGPLFSFTWFLHVSYRPPFFIYMVFTGLQT